MKFKKGDIVRRLYDLEQKTNLLWEITLVDIDEVGNIIISLKNIVNKYDTVKCYPEQLQKLEKIC